MELVQRAAPGGELLQELALGQGWVRAVGGRRDGEAPLLVLAAVIPDVVLVSPLAQPDLLPASVRLDLLCHHPVITGLAEEVDLLLDVPRAREAGRRDDRAAQDGAVVSTTVEQELQALVQHLVLVDVDVHGAVVTHYSLRPCQVHMLPGHGTNALVTDLEESGVVGAVDEPARNIIIPGHHLEALVSDDVAVALQRAHVRALRVELQSPFTRLLHDVYDVASLVHATYLLPGLRRFQHFVYLQPAATVHVQVPVTRAMAAHVNDELCELAMKRGRLR